MVATNSKLLSTGRTIETGTIPGKVGNTATEIPYTLYIWIDSMAGDDDTQADIMNKIFNARLGITAEQHHASTVENVGDVILYNPVTLQRCNNVSESNCYEWIVLSKNNDNQIKDFLYLRDDQNLLVSSNAFTTLETFTSNWNEELSVDEEYNLPSAQGPPFDGYEFGKARFPLANEITESIINTLKSNNVDNSTSEPYNKMITSYDTYIFGTTGNSVYYDYNEETDEDIETLTFVNSGFGPYGMGVYSDEYTSYYVHPVIRIEGISEVGTCKASNFKVGDYISMTPTETNYPVPSSLTGYASNPALNPSELNVWRVIDIHNDGSLDMISDSISSTKLLFRGTTGYTNYIGALNTIAHQYENTKYTIGSRHMGYNGQTAVISNTSVFDGTSLPDETIPNTSRPQTGTGQEYTKISSGDIGDTLYLKDYQLVNNVYGTVRANIVGTSTPGMYFLASRSVGNEGKSFYGRTINPGLNENTGLIHVISLRHYDEDYGWKDKDSSAGFGDSVRPIVVLKSGVTISGGKGTSSRPYKLC